MSAQSFELLLARLYTDQTVLGEFLKNPTEVVENADLTAEEKQAMLNVDRQGLMMAAHSFKSKKEKWLLKPKKNKFRFGLNRAKKILAGFRID